MIDPALALAGLIIVAVGFELRRLHELAQLVRDPGTPPVIRSMPLTFKAPSAPYQSSTGAPS